MHPAKWVNQYQAATQFCLGFSMELSQLPRGKLCSCPARYTHLYIVSLLSGQLARPSGPRSAWLEGRGMLEWGRLSPESRTTRDLFQMGPSWLQYRDIESLTERHLP